MVIPENIRSTTTHYGSHEILTSRVESLEGGCVYTGTAQPGSSEDSPVWLITRNETENGVNITVFANGSGSANQKWSDLHTLPIEFI